MLHLGVQMGELPGFPRDRGNSVAFLASGFEAPQEDLDDDLEAKGGKDEAVAPVLEPGARARPGAVAPYAVKAPGERRSNPGKKDTLVRASVVRFTPGNFSHWGREIGRAHV